MSIPFFIFEDLSEWVIPPKMTSGDLIKKRLFAYNYFF